MPVHLLKLCVGVDEPAELIEWHRDRLAEFAAAGQPAELVHTTRSTPRRREEVLDGGSLYWVIRGAIQIRQTILDLRPVTAADGTERCQIVLGHKHVTTSPAPRRPFQGWRYLEAGDAPRDAGSGGTAKLPPELYRELAALGLL